jgi:hypothetical protein
MRVMGCAEFDSCQEGTIVVGRTLEGPALALSTRHSELVKIAVCAWALDQKRNIEPRGLMWSAVVLCRRRDIYFTLIHMFLGALESGVLLFRRLFFLILCLIHGIIIYQRRVLVRFFVTAALTPNSSKQRALITRLYAVCTAQPTYIKLHSAP